MPSVPAAQLAADTPAPHEDEEAGAGASEDFGHLILRAKRAHDSEVARLQGQVDGLRRRLACTRGGQAHPPATALGKRADTPVVPDPPRRSSGEPLPTEGCPRAAGPSEQEPARCSSRPLMSHGEGAEALHAAPASPPGSPLPAGAPKARRVFQTVRRQESLLRHTEAKGRLYRLVTHPGFEMLIALVILANGAVMAAEAQYQGLDVAVWTGHESAGGGSSVEWPHGDDVFRVCEWMFGVVFSLELALRIAALRSLFVRELWNWMDMLVVALWIFTRLNVGVNMNVQMLRLARLARLLRLIRLIRYMNDSGVDSLFVLVTSLKGSVTILAWSFSLLLTLHVLLALAMNQALHLWYFEESQAERQVVVFEYFGSFSRSLLTMFEFTLGNWVPPARVLMEKVHEMLVVYSVLHKMILGFAVVAVIHGVFMQETFKVATLDDTIMVRQVQRKERTHIAKMRTLFAEADIDENSTVDREEWLQVCKDSWVQAWLKSQDFDLRDPNRLFDALDNGSGALTAESLIEGTGRLKGEASPMAMARLLNEVRDSVKLIQCELNAAREFDRNAGGSDEERH